MNKIKLHLTNRYGDTYGAVVIDRIQCGTFMCFKNVTVSESNRDDFNFVVTIDNNNMVYCHEIEIKHPVKREEWYFGLGSPEGKINQTIQDWLWLFKEGW